MKNTLTFLFVLICAVNSSFSQQRLASALIDNPYIVDSNLVKTEEDIRARLVWFSKDLLRYHKPIVGEYYGITTNSYMIKVMPLGKFAKEEGDEEMSFEEFFYYMSDGSLPYGPDIKYEEFIATDQVQGGFYYRKNAKPTDLGAYVVYFFISDLTYTKTVFGTLFSKSPHNKRDALMRDFIKRTTFK